MHIAAVSRVDMTVDHERASAEFRMQTRRLQAWTLVLSAAAGMVGLIMPPGLIIVDSITNPQVINTLAEHPGSTALLVAGIAIGLLLLSFPLRAGLYRLGAAGTVVMANGQVTMERQGILGRECWSAPLNQFCGVTHHIRATLSGPRHEIILVHPEPSRDVLLHIANRHPQEGADHYANLLGLTEMQPKVLYKRRRNAAHEPHSIEIQAKAA